MSQEILPTTRRDYAERPLTPGVIEAMRGAGKAGYLDTGNKAWDMLCDLALKGLDTRSEIKPITTAKELNRLRDIEHYAWHLMDSSEENAGTGEITIRPMREDYEKLSALLPEGHPSDEEHHQ